MIASENGFILDFGEWLVVRYIRLGVRNIWLALEIGVEDLYHNIEWLWSKPIGLR